MKTVFTTGEAAKICKVSQQTIIRCFDNGRLMGFRVPGSRFRRISREALYKFMKDNGIPTDGFECSEEEDKLTDAELNEIIYDLKVLAPVQKVGMSLADFLNNVCALKAENLAKLTACLYKLYRHADCAYEPQARPDAQEFIDRD